MPPVEVIAEESGRRPAGHFNLIHQMLRISGDLIDRGVLEQWAARLGVMGEWQQAQNFTSPR